MSDEPFGVAYSGYRIINTCMLGEWLGSFSAACDRRRPVPPECHTLCSGVGKHREGRVASVSSDTLSFYGIWSSESPEITTYWRLELETAFSTRNSRDS